MKCTLPKIGGQAKASQVKPWMRSVEGGVMDPRTNKTHSPYQHDKMTLYYSGQLILYPVTCQYHCKLTRALGEQPHSPLLICHLLKNRLTLVQSRQRKLIDELQDLSLASEPAENVRNFNVFHYSPSEWY